MAGCARRCSRALFTSLNYARRFGGALNRLTGDGLLHVVSDLGQRCGIRARPHGLRHSAITQALDLFNGDCRRVRQFSRHASLEVLLRYDDARRDDAGTIAQAVEDFVG